MKLTHPECLFFSHHCYTSAEGELGFEGFNVKLKNLLESNPSIRLCQIDIETDLTPRGFFGAKCDINITTFQCTFTSDNLNFLYCFEIKISERKQQENPEDEFTEFDTVDCFYNLIKTNLESIK